MFDLMFDSGLIPYSLFVCEKCFILSFSNAKDCVPFIQGTAVIDNIFLEIFAGKNCADLFQCLENKSPVFLI